MSATPTIHKSASAVSRGASSRRRRRRRNAVARPGAPIIFFFFFFHRRYCTSIFIPPHVPARRPARGGREKMQPPNTIDRYKHTRSYHGRVLLRVQRLASRAPGSQRAEGDRKRVPSKDGGRRQGPIGVGSEIATNHETEREREGQGEREKKREGEGVKKRERERG